MKFLRAVNPSVRLLVILGVFLGLLTLGLGRHLLIVQAEQSGGSPTAGSDSRLKQLADNLESANYGDPANGALGNWGTYWNRISSAAKAPFSDAVAKGLTNGGNANYPQNVGGIHDDTTLPAGSYQSTWTICNSGNSYCGTGDSNAEKRDENTGLVWSTRTSASANWWTANNCQQPSNGVAPTGPNACTANGDEGCKCVKLTSSKTGCEALGDGNWRLPYQKETMMAYIDGSASNLSNAAANYWSSTTNTTNTQFAWYTHLSNGGTSLTTKTTSNSFRCVR
jgi:hypothetical protein